MIGSGRMHGTLGIVPGTGGIGRDGGTLMYVGRMIGIGIIATLIITITTVVLSVTRSILVEAIRNCIMAFLIATTPPLTRIALLSVVTAA